jgi:ubiquinone/menaquinone biosynthesis C-methylase UbiE
MGQADAAAVNRAFSRQSVHYDQEDAQNPVLRDMREQVYRHVSKYIKVKSTLLELNAGTGIDALYFAREGHTVLATDLSDGMIAQIEKKIKENDVGGRLQCRQLSFENLQELHGNKYDYVFSNFGGLNCLGDLANVTESLSGLLTKGARVTLVVMPTVSVWELASVLKGNGHRAFRRFQKNGVRAHLEGEYFQTHYHSLRRIKRAFRSGFRFVASEGLGALSPPPSRGDFPARHPSLYRMIRQLDNLLRHSFPFNRWADHIIVTFEWRG